MVALIAFPFRITSTGQVVTNEHDSDEYYAGELAMICMTHPEERELVPDFGITDPTFGEFDEVEFLSQVEVFGPPVVITNVEKGFSRSGQGVVTIEFDSNADDIDVADNEEEEGEEL